MSILPVLALAFDDKGRVTESVPLSECTMDQLYDLKSQLNMRWQQSLAYNSISLRKQIEFQISMVDERLESMMAAAQVREWRRERGEDVPEPDSADNLPSFVSDEDEIDFLIDD